jgi:hypothetical protein
MAVGQGPNWGCSAKGIIYHVLQAILTKTSSKQDFVTCAAFYSY